MEAQSIIVSVADRRQAAVNARIAAIEGRRYVPRPVFFRNLKSGAEYYAIAGAIAFPVGKAPGFALVAGILKEIGREQAPRLRVLNEIEEPTIVGLLAACEKARWLWGFPRTLSVWIGDPERYMQAIADFNDRNEMGTSDNREGIYLSPPADFEDSRRDELYLETIRQLLSPGPDGEKRLMIGNSPRLRAHLQNAQPDLKKVEEIPALAGLGFAVHTLLSDQPWLDFTRPERFHPTIKADGFEQVPSWLWEDDEASDEDWGQCDDGDLVTTVKSYKL
jgi:hypothetical protein